MMREQRVRGAVLVCLLLGGPAVMAQDPSIVLEDGGIQFPDGSVQMTSAIVTDPPPPTLTVNVDCAGGDSIAAALAQPADQLTIEIRGICTENVVVSRNDVTIRGADPLADGIQAGNVRIPTPFAMEVVGVRRGVQIQNLQLAGVPGGLAGPLSVFHSQVAIINCRLQDGPGWGVRLADSVATFRDTVITGNAKGGLNSDGGYFRCRGCTIESNGGGGFGTGIKTFQSEFDLEDSGVEGAGAYAIEMHSGRLGVTGSSSIEFLGGGDGVAIRAREHAMIELKGASVTGPMVVTASVLVLDESTTQSLPVEFLGSNEAWADGGFYVVGGSTLAGDLGLYLFSSAFFQSGTSLSGNLECEAGADAWCEDSSVISGTSNCAQCVKAP